MPRPDHGSFHAARQGVRRFWFCGFFMNDEQLMPSPDEQPTAGRLTSQSIRSFVLRQGRMSEAQHRFLDEMMPKVGIDFRPEPIDLAQVFGRKAPQIVEIGFGMGEATAHIARVRPDDNFLCCEVHEPGVGALLKRIGEAVMHANVDAGLLQQVLEQRVADELPA